MPTGKTSDASHALCHKTVAKQHIIRWFGLRSHALPMCGPHHYEDGMATKRSCSSFGRKARLAGAMDHLHVPQAGFIVWRMAAGYCRGGPIETE